MEEESILDDDDDDNNTTFSYSFLLEHKQSSNGAYGYIITSIVPQYFITAT